VSGSGAPQLVVSGEGKTIYVVATSWHPEIMDGLIQGALKELEKAQAKEVVLERVPGAFELPLAAKFAFDKGAHAVIALGVVIRGETPHFDYVCASATDGLTELQLTSGIPIGFGLLTVDDEAQALARAGLPGSKEDKGAEAVQAALHMLSLKP
jgi:6,7-dimethyl-8-ribityllumazine synthase